MPDALIVIDMQRGSFVDAPAKYDAAGLIGRLNRLAATLRNAGGSVIFVQHDGPPGDPHHPSLPGWRILDELEVRAEDPIVRKTACDAFLDTKLETVLRTRGVERLIVTGCATDYCVDTTVRSALSRYPTIVPSDGHTTSDRPHLRATKIIEHHNTIWADFIAPRGPAMVQPCASLCF
jgi:nicotinamidase-related amidase